MATFTDLKKCHFKVLYSYVSSEAFDERENEEKDVLLFRILKILEILYSHLSYKSLKPPLFYLMPHRESHLEFVFTKQSSKIQLDDAFHLMLWVNLAKRSTPEERCIFSVTNQLGEGLKLQVKEGTLEVVVMRRISSLTGNTDQSVTHESYPAQPIEMGELQYILMAYEYRKCRVW